MEECTGRSDSGSYDSWYDGSSFDYEDDEECGGSECQPKELCVYSDRSDPWVPHPDAFRPRVEQTYSDVDRLLEEEARPMARPLLLRQTLYADGERSGDWAHDSDGGDDTASSARAHDHSWARCRHATLAATILRLDPRPRRAAACSSSESRDSVRVPRCFQDDAADRSGSSTASEADEQPQDGAEDLWCERLTWRTDGPYLAPSRWRRHRLPTPQLSEETPPPPPPPPHPALLQTAVREAVSRLGAGIAAETLMEFHVEYQLLARVQHALAPLAKHCRGEGAVLLAAAAAACALRPLTSYADLHA